MIPQMDHHLPTVIVCFPSIKLRITLCSRETMTAFTRRSCGGFVRAVLKVLSLSNGSLGQNVCVSLPAVPKPAHR